MDQEKCQDCQTINSCIYLKDRFGTTAENKEKGCKYDRIQVELVHNEELARREILLKGLSK